jgi:hypothetical protein
MEREAKLNLLREDGSFLYKFRDLQGDKEAVLIALQTSGYAYTEASPELQADIDVRIALVKKNFHYLKLISPKLRDKEVMMAAVKINGYALEFAPHEMKADKEVVMIAVQNGPALKFASPEMQADKEVVLASVRLRMLTIQFASAELQRDEDVIRTSLGREYVAMGYNNIHMDAEKGDYVTIATKEPQSNPVVHQVSVLLPDGRVQLNNNTISTIYVPYLNFVPESMVIRNSLGLRLRDRTFSIQRKGGKNKKVSYGTSKKQRTRIKRSICRTTRY